MEKYVKVRKIGQGSFGSAYLATRKTSPAADSKDQKQQFVIKEILLDPRDQANAQREARLLAALDHPNIIACKESFLLKPPPPSAAYVGHHQQRKTVLCIVTEFADGGDLSHEIERRARRRQFFEPDEILGLFVQVCLALKHLHDRKILHRDVKPANVFLTKSGVVKVGDLGVATVLSHTLACAETSIGTPYYTAPEICLGKRYNAKADVWSLGCVLFEMASFEHVFDGRSQRQLFENIVRGATPPLPPCGSLNSIKHELQGLINDMLRKEPRARPSVNQIIRRPLVLARIQTFLSARALASELNHTVLHGENVFRKKTVVEDKVGSDSPLVHHVRNPEPVARSPAVNAFVRPSPQKPEQKIKEAEPVARSPNAFIKPASRGKARVGSLLGASRKVKGLPAGAFRRSRSFQKRDQPARVPSRISAVNNANVAKQRVIPARGKRSAALAAQAKAKLKAQIKENEAAAAAVAALPDPPAIPNKMKKLDGALGGISDRVAAFNAKASLLMFPWYWAAQKEEIVNNLPPPPPTKSIAKKGGVATKLKKSARAYPKPVVIGKSPNASKQVPPPAPVGIRRQPAKQRTPLWAPKARAPAVRDSQPSLRERRLEFQRQKKSEAGDQPKASPLDDPIILVQQLPNFKPPPAAPIEIEEPTEQVAVLPPPAPSSLGSTLPECVDKNAVGMGDSTGDEDHEETLLPPMSNLEFERMVLQLKSAVESDLTISDEDDDEDEQDDPNLPPPPYSPPETTPSLSSLSLETLNISVLENAAFRSALQKSLQQNKANDAVPSTNEQVSLNGNDELVVDPAHQASLTWMQTYIASLL
ncbi:Protein kinase [Phytophthora megakarya]|uniref:non-specific serine/threonine protein kinase n=1 Tax=Phytophthora megakarya TaxID=4795 RepID=A0A225WSI3_9STRA|nr:Protein kinase [Phytophthora megakarya]